MNKVLDKCHESRREYGRKYAAKNRVSLAVYIKEYRDKNIAVLKMIKAAKGAWLKKRVIYTYSSGSMGCALCKESRLPCLSIDHINGGGCLHRKKIVMKSGTPFYAWLENNGFPEGFRVLCMNCQFIEMHRIRQEAK